ncbi:MAG: superoxide dismutase [Nanoarchaeota archaeon]|nr:superoxide dismutase [Nanoarchaeota archaeon]MBU1050986.1 superoxide dismutase [Nanoarchaeota archaeon]
MTFELPDLGYGFDALEPWIDAKTMGIHHDKHHKTYTDKFNAALEKHPELFDKSAEEIISDLDSVPEDIKGAVRNNCGGYVNHALFWQILGRGKELKGKLKESVEKEFGSFEDFKKDFGGRAATLFGSGWVWLVVSNGKLEIVSTTNQDSPLSEGKTPILVLDVWEHAYYLKYQNKRPDYIEAFFSVINWDKVGEMYEKARG